MVAYMAWWEDARSSARVIVVEIIKIRMVGSVLMATIRQIAYPYRKLQAILVAYRCYHVRQLMKKVSNFNEFLKIFIFIIFVFTDIQIEDWVLNFCLKI